MKNIKHHKIIPKKLPLAIALALNSLCVSAQFNPVEELSELNGINGFVINGVAVDDISGGSVSAAGDINGDGLDDIMIGATFVDTNGNNSGASYVVFGSNSGFTPSLNLGNLDGNNGFVINGVAAGDFLGGSVSAAGDINGDGLDDIVIGARDVDTNGSYSGASYVVFGSDSGFAPSMNLGNLNGNNGFVINGVVASDFSGGSVSAAGDVNGDGLDDLIIGATFVDTNGSSSGASYVVFGSNSGFTPSLNLGNLDGNNGFVINGVAAGDFLGGSVSAAGDVNGDGLDDIIIGARGVDTNGSNSGASYVVFGSDSGFSPSLNLSSLNGNNGFVINGVAEFDSSSRSVSAAGDVNGDGFDDIIIGADRVDTNGITSGASYVVFGSDPGFAPSLNLSSLNGNNGFVINGVAIDDRSGESVSAAGDVNGDGLDDIVIGAYGVDTNGSTSGASYVVFGSDSGFAPSMNLGSLNGNNGFVINGVAAGDFSGLSVSAAGDVNGDGLDDIVIGAFGVDTNGSDSGASYVVFGAKKETRLNPMTNQIGFFDIFGYDVDISNNFAIVGALGDDTQGSGSGAAYIYHNNQGVWSQITKLTPSDGANNDLFGWSVAIDGNLALVGAHHEDGDGGPSGDSGSVYAYQQSSNGTWDFIQKIRASDAQDGDQFGFDISIDGNSAVIGANLVDVNGVSDTGSAYVFQFDSNSTIWNQITKLEANDRSVADNFGSAVAIDGDNIAIGAPDEDGPNTTTGDSGSVYMYRKLLPGWQQNQKIRATISTDEDSFGFSVALDGSHLAVGAKGNNFTGTNSGAAYIFKQASFSGSWSQINYFSRSVAGDNFGYSIDISENKVLVGSIKADGGRGFANSGSSYLFELNNGAITHLEEFNSASSRLGDQFGFSVGLSNRHAIVGTPFDDNNGSNSGSVYLFDVFFEELIFNNGFE